jgi:hypothetical protein
MAKHSGEEYLKLVLLNIKGQVIGKPRLTIDYGLRYSLEFYIFIKKFKF